MRAPKQERAQEYHERDVNQFVPMPEEDDSAIDPRDLLRILWRGKWIIVICTLIAAFLGFLASSQKPAVYRATAKVMFDLRQGDLANLPNVFVQEQYNASKLEDQIEVLQSTVLVERVIKDLNLDENPAFNPFLRTPAPTRLERIERFVAIPPEVVDLAINIGLIAPPTPPPDPVETAHRERLAVIQAVLAGLQLQPVGRSRVIEIGYVSGQPGTAAAVANSFAEQYIVDQLEAKLEAADAATSWLRTRVDELRVRVETTETAIGAASMSISDASGQSLEVTLQQLQGLNGSLAAQTAAASKLEALHDRLSTAVEGGADLGTISEFRASPLIQRFRSEETDLLSQKITQESRVSAGHPSLLRIEQQLAEVQRNITLEAERIVSATYLDLLAAKDQEANLLSDIRQLEQKALVQSGDKAQVRQLEREADVARSLYENLLTRLQETTAQQDLQDPDARVLSPAERPLFPIGQQKNRNLLIATVIGGVVGIGIAFLLDRLNNTFRSPAQLEELTGETLLGVLPGIGSRLKRSDVLRHLREKPGSSLVESVRNLRTSILFSNFDSPPKVVMFTSSVPREGKSTSSMLVALTSRQMGKSAVIVDCDLRLPTLSNLMNATKHQHGLISVLEGSCEIDEAMFKDPDTGLHVLTTVAQERNSNVNAADILSSRKFENLISKLSEIYDLVILDTPPTLVVADARIISRLVDAVVYMVRWDKTPRGAVLEGLKDLRSLNAPIAGVVMTLVNEARASNYTYDGYSYYKGKYRDYYSA